MKFLLLLLFIGIPQLVFANSNSQWQELNEFLNEYCREQACQDNISKAHFLRILRIQGYGCIVIPQELAGMLRRHQFWGFSQYEGFLVSYLDEFANYQQKVQETEAVLSQLHSAGMSQIHLAEPSSALQDFISPYRPFCGNNTLILDKWQGLINPITVNLEANTAPPLLLVFTGEGV